MPGTILPLPIMLEEEDQKIYDRLEPPKTMVVRYGYQKRVAELPYNGDAKPGCGSKLVIRTDRGTEIAEMLTTTCPNAGCGKSVSRKEMLDYISNSGGRDYPFTTQGRVLRVASVEDMNQQSRIDDRKAEFLRLCRGLIEEQGLPMKLVEVELLLGAERAIFYYMSQSYVDFRELVQRLAQEMQTRIEMVQVNDREEARLVADYEKCGQHCCCKQFLKVLKPISMRSAKVQKATVDPSKISGRCGRLMCCLRYEDQTYDDLRKRLPNRKAIVETPDGVGTVVDTQILTQLALVRVGDEPAAAYPVENIRLLDKEEARAWRAQNTPPEPDQRGGGGGGRGGERRGPRRSPDGTNQAARPHRGQPRRPGPGQPLGENEVESKEGTDSPQVQAGGGNRTDAGYTGSADTGGDDAGTKKKRRRRRRRKGGGGGGDGGDGGGGGGGGDGGGGDGGGDGGGGGGNDG